MWSKLEHAGYLPQCVGAGFGIWRLRSPGRSKYLERQGQGSAQMALRFFQPGMVDILHGCARYQVSSIYSLLPLKVSPADWVATPMQCVYYCVFARTQAKHTNKQSSYCNLALGDRLIACEGLEMVYRRPIQATASEDQSCK